MYTDILQKCIKIADKKQEQYGEADKSLKLCSELLKKIFHIELSTADICNVLVCLKLSRESNTHKDDNILDTINYLAISLNSKKFIKRIIS